MRMHTYLKCDREFAYPALDNPMYSTSMKVAHWQPREHSKGRIKVKPIKMFGLAALLALMVMAFLGASSAMAETTALCETEAGPENPCESMITHVHETSVSKAKLLSTSTVECDVLFLGDVQEEGSPMIING